MRLDVELFDRLTELADMSERGRMHFDLRTSLDDNSQRMLNALTLRTDIPIHRHNDTSETVVICRGAVREEFYDEHGNKTDEFILTAGGNCTAVQVPKGVYHTCVCLIDGSVIFEAKDGKYDPLSTEDYLLPR